MTPLAASATYQAPVKTKAEILADVPQLEAEIGRLMQQNQVLGLSMAVVVDGEVIYARGFGAKDGRTDSPVDKGTIFQAASLSKPVSAYAALLLAQQGKLALDAPLADYMRGPYLLKAGDARSITLRMVLSHTSGMSNDPSGRHRQVAFKPGARFRYSGGGFRYLMQAMEDTTGQPYAGLMRELLLAPLGMAASTFDYAVMPQSRFALGPSERWEMPANAAYSLLTTPSDYAVFLSELMAPTLLGEELGREVVKPQVAVNKTVSWGLGIGLQHSPIGDAVWHWGNNGGVYYSFAVGFLNEKTGVVIMTNSKNGVKILKEAAFAAIGGHHYDYMGKVR